MASTSSTALAALIKERQGEYRAAQKRASKQGKAAFVRRADMESTRRRDTGPDPSSASSSAAGLALGLAPQSTAPQPTAQRGKKRQRGPIHDAVSSDEMARQQRILLFRKRSREAAIAANVAAAAAAAAAKSNTPEDDQAAAASSASAAPASESASSKATHSVDTHTIVTTTSTAAHGNDTGASRASDRNVEKAPPTSKDAVEREDEKTTGKNTRRIFKRYIDEWAEDLRNRSDKEKRSALGREESKRFKLCKDNIRPMFKLSRQGKLTEDLRTAIRLIAHYVHVGEYVKGHDQYILLAIGNAAWPIGVTMVGIHARGGRERIQSNKIAHAMDDELTLKYLTSIKRLISYAQRKYPSAPSKMVVM